MASLSKVTYAFLWIYVQVCCFLNCFLSLFLRIQFHDFILFKVSISSLVCWKIGQKRRNYSAKRWVNLANSVCSKMKWVFWKVDHKPAHKLLPSLLQAYVQKCIYQRPFFTKTRERRNRERTGENFELVPKKKQLFANTRLVFFWGQVHLKFLWFDAVKREI